MEIRSQTEQIEHQFFVKSASFSDQSLGRQTPETPCPIRTCYQRDRDRILHCKAFRRLKHKTQVFLAPQGDHYTTRLTHTLEVSQVARTIARALRLNEDLTEAIALGHDLGHTPFGHSGEAVLGEICPLGFAHYEQSVRVVDRLEQNGHGLNLTLEVRDGILRHTTGQQAFTLEGRLVRLADRLAYVCHDIEDAKRAGMLAEEELPQQARQILGRKKSQRITTLVINCIENGEAIALSGQVAQAFEELHRFMYQYVYQNPSAKTQEKKAIEMLRQLYVHFRKNLGKMPEEYRRIAEIEGPERAVCDYISGMTDTYAIGLFEALYVPTLYVPARQRQEEGI